MHPKLKADASEPVLVRTPHEKKIYIWTVISSVTVIVTLAVTIALLVITLWPSERKPPVLGQRTWSNVVLTVIAFILMLSGWLNVKAARALHQARSSDLSGAGLGAPKGLRGVDEFAVGGRVRVKARLTQQEKEAGPGWEPRMDISLGKQSVVTSVDKHGWISLEDFPKCLFLKEWLEALKE